MNTDVVFAQADYRFYLTTITRTSTYTEIIHVTAQFRSLALVQGQGRIAVITHHQRSAPDKADFDHAFPVPNASSPAATRVPAMSADQSSTGKLVEPVRAWAVCSARAVSRLWCAVSIAGIGELCSAVSLRICEASLTPPSMAKPTVPSNLSCNILSPYETHLRIE